MAEIFWHSLKIEDIERIQRTDLRSGLSEKEVEIRKREFGLNEIKEKKPATKLIIFLRQFKSVLILILLFAAVLLLFLAEFVDSLAVFLILLLNATIGFFQEYKATKIFESLKKVLKIEARVIRDKRERIIEAKDLVPGDIVVLTAGQKVPADGRIFDSQYLKIEEMILTGEFLPSLKHFEVLPEKTSLADRENMAFMGTVVVDGKGKMIVTETGKETEIGKIAEEIQKGEKTTPLQKKIKKLSLELAIFLLFVVCVTFALGLIREKNLLLLFETVVALAVSAIPEGLPVAITVALAISAQRILKKQGLIRNLASVETLGSCSLILADKTLTLTEGKMEIAEIIGKRNLVLKGGALSIDAFVENPQDPKEKWQIRGRPIEKTILKKAIEEGIEKQKFEDRKILEIPFDPVKKFAGAIYKEGEKRTLYLCGAPEKLLELSSLSEKEKQEWEKKLKEAGEKGWRMVASAQKDFVREKSFEDLIKKKNFEFLGLIVFRDPIRKGVKEAIEAVREAGIQPIIISGDRKETVIAVAREVGIEIKEAEVLDGEELDEISDEQLSQILPKIKIFARTEPRHKLRIAKAWQQKGKIIAMTGDGVNDAPALRAADIGIAVGSGTEVVKEASDLILLKDDFSLIKETIKEGRRLMDNARKAILFMCMECFSEIILVFAAFLTNLPLPILPIQILWKNFIEGSPQGLAFAFESEEKEIMKRSPENPKAPILTREIKYLILIAGILTDIVLFILFVILFNFFNLPIEKIRTFCFAGLAFGSFCYAFSCKNFRKNIWQYNPFSNRVLNLTLTMGLAFLILTIYLPPFQFLLKTASLGIFEWSILLLFGFINLFLFELVKYFLRIKSKR
ncbi:MAG: cation-translocating P-type ATPase [Minisyncoccales bacterium]